MGVKSKYDVDSIGLQAMTGYDFNTNIATITPEVGMRYVNIKQDGYKDSADQKVGLGLTTEVNDSVELNVGWL